MRRKRRRHRWWHTVFYVAGGVVVVMLLPVLLPVALFQHAREQKRMRALAEIFACLRCGRILGADALRLADEAWSAHMARLHGEFGGDLYRFRVVKTFDAICPNCAAYHSFVAKERRFVLTRREDIPLKPGEERPTFPQV